MNPKYWEPISGWEGRPDGRSEILVDKAGMVIAYLNPVPQPEFAGELFSVSLAFHSSRWHEMKLILKFVSRQAARNWVLKAFTEEIERDPDATNVPA
jgi:hypothetical protein